MSRPLIAIGAICASLSLAGPAVAATQIGQLAGPSSGCGDNVTVIQSGSPNDLYAAPSAGVITSWSYFAGFPGPGIELKVARPAGGDYFSIVGESPRHTPGANMVNTYTDVRIPVQQGDVIGYYNVAGGSCFSSTAGPSQYHLIFGDQPPGPTALPMTSGTGTITIAAILELDCDGDGFGDETQDGDVTSCDPSPDTQITKRPKAKTKKKRTTFKFSGTDVRAVASFECSLDGGAFAVCTSPHTVKVKKGKHTFAVRAVDQAGNVDGSPATDDWKVKRKKRRR